MTPEALDILSRIEHDTKRLRAILNAGANVAVAVPALKPSYTKATAKKERDSVRAAETAGLIDMNKRAGLMRGITVRTQGYVDPRHKTSRRVSESHAI